MRRASSRSRAVRRCGAVASFLAALLCTVASAAPQLDKLRVPAGFRVELLTDAVPDARQMALGRHDASQGVVYVGSLAGKVYAVQYGQGARATVHTVASGLQLPTGVAWRDGALFVGASARVLRFDGIDDKLAAPPAPVVVTDRFPSETHHGRRFIGFGPEGRLYVAVGAPCNICQPDDRHGVVQRMSVDGTGEIETVARGVRNSVGFDWNPADKTLWFTDNGRDLLGDDLPADELDHVTRSGEHFGFPFCHQGDSPDPEFGAQHPCSEFTAPAAKLGAHVAALGMRFYTGTQFPAAYRGNIFIAEHGSWNRSRKVGYQVVRVALDAQGRPGDPEPFLQGFLQVDGARESVWGRPADVLPLPDGSMLVSDDTAGAIYRIRYGQ
jgi:glucose/arabinose dehydrogenase